MSSRILAVQAAIRVGHLAAYARVGMVRAAEAEGFPARMVAVGEGVEHLRQYLAVHFLGCPSGKKFTRLLLVAGAGIEEPPHPQVVHHEPAIRRVTVVAMGHHRRPGLRTAAVGEDPVPGPGDETTEGDLIDPVVLVVLNPDRHGRTRRGRPAPQLLGGAPLVPVPGRGEQPFAFGLREPQPGLRAEDRGEDRREPSSTARRSGVVPSGSTRSGSASPSTNASLTGSSYAATAVSTSSESHRRPAKESPRLAREARPTPRLSQASSCPRP
ncbi:hypothetical protein AB0H18_01395 [Streptomyces sp. NPDC020766]|uniref:hypothetical protein n=1 Tax=Streptomyces sp. NPDC020766 TaxID=3155011 RepID=UPI0033CCCBDE